MAWINYENKNKFLISVGVCLIIATFLSVYYAVLMAANGMDESVIQKSINCTSSNINSTDCNIANARVRIFDGFFQSVLIFFYSGFFGGLVLIFWGGFFEWKEDKQEEVKVKTKNMTSHATWKTYLGDFLTKVGAVLFGGNVVALYYNIIIQNLTLWNPFILLCVLSGIVILVGYFLIDKDSAPSLTVCTFFRKR